MRSAGSKVNVQARSNNDHSNPNGRTSLAALGAALCFVAGCVGGGRVAPASSLAQLEPEATVQLGSPAVCICRDGDGLLALENSGTRIIRYSFRDSALGTVPVRGQSPWRLASAPQETLPLTERLTAPAGVAADRFYVYVFDDHVLSRMSKEKLSLEAWLGNVRGRWTGEPGARGNARERRGPWRNLV